MNTLIPIIPLEDGTPVIDSRVIALHTEVQHETVMRLLETHKEKLESYFGILRFEIGKPSAGTSGGRPPKWALLTEPQASYLMTLTRNTDVVTTFKAEFVQAFYEFKARLLHPAPQPELPEQEFPPLLPAHAITTRRFAEVRSLGIEDMKSFRKYLNQEAAADFLPIDREMEGWRMRVFPDDYVDRVYSEWKVWRYNERSARR